MRWFRIMAAAGALVLGVAGAGVAKPLLQEDFSSAKPVPGGGTVVVQGKGHAWRGPGGQAPRGAGGYLMYDVKLGKAGTVEFDITRGERGRQFETPFSLAGADGNELVTMSIQWVDTEGHTRINMDTVSGPLYETNVVPEGLYRQGMEAGLSLDRQIGRGSTVHIAFTWNAEHFKLYVNGKALKADAVHSPRLVSALAGQVSKVVVGGVFLKRWPTTVFNRTQSLIANFQIHDVELAASQLDQPIAPKTAIASIRHNATRAAGFSGKLVAGDKLQVTLEGQAGAKGSFDILPYPDIDGAIDLDWRGWGVYLEEKTFFADGEVNLRDFTGYRVYASTSPLGEITVDTEPLEKLKVGEQTYKLEKLLANTPYYVAVYAEKRDGTLVPVQKPVEGVALAEQAPGVYAGQHTVAYTDRFPRAVVVGHLALGATTTTAVEPNFFEIAPALVIKVATSPSELKADEKSTSKITVTVTDANGKAVPAHKVKFLLATTSQYTGVVGGGAFKEQVGGTVQGDYWAETDLFGRVEATYVAGFAAKTAVIVARDMTSNDTGAGWVKTYIQTAAELELEPVNPVAAAVQGYEITVTSSDKWLTADGKSQARITARVTLSGKPVEGHRVSFGVSAGTGSIRVVKDVTDRNGEARAVYTAGKKIGMVLVTATDTDVDISGSVQIELRSDAPAKIDIKITPPKIPADGRSSAQVAVRVSDINDNPNDNVEVEYRVAEGSGRLRDNKTVTDRNGESGSEFVAGRTPGKVSIEITVRSTVPTEEELGKARNLALAVPDYDFF